MFPVYPGFENLPLRVEVQWRGATRPVVARLEQWPDSDKVILVCAFEDDKDVGEYAFLVGDHIYPLSPITQSGKWLKEMNVFDVATREPRQILQPRPSNLKRLRRLIVKTFSERRIVRLFHFPHLPEGPHFVSESPTELSWSFNGQLQIQSAFNVDVASTPFQMKATHMQKQLQIAWNNLDSDARFVWKWVSLNEESKYELLLGIGMNINTMQHLMNLILTSATSLWEMDEQWTWMLCDNPEDSVVGSPIHKRYKTKKFCEVWSQLLQNHFVSQLRDELMQEHSCVRTFWKNRSSIITFVQVSRPPTFHEQLEAKLQLRDWLQDKATPAEIEQLLAI